MAAGTVASAGIGGTVAADGTVQSDGTLFSAGVLSGDQEVPPVDTDGAGAAVFLLDADETELRYVLVVAQTETVTQAHIHLGERGENGDVVAFLFGKTDEDGEFAGALDQGVTENGVLAEGTITEDDLVGPLAGESLRALAAEMGDENAYVNVHTERNPAGEIRGQIETVEEAEIELEERVEVDARGSSIDVTVEIDLEIDDRRRGRGRGRDGDDGRNGRDGDDDRDGDDGRDGRRGPGGDDGDGRR